MPRGLVLAANRPTDVDVNVRNEAFLSSSDAGGGRSPRSQASEVGVRERFESASIAFRIFQRANVLRELCGGLPWRQKRLAERRREMLYVCLTMNICIVTCCCTYGNACLQQASIYHAGEACLCLSRMTVNTAGEKDCMGITCPVRLRWNNKHFKGAVFGTIRVTQCIPN